MSYFPLIIVLILAILDWIAADKKWKILEYFAKPVTMLALLLWMVLNIGWGGSILWFTLGVILCLAGDVFLMLREDFFIFGLFAFLLGHIFYVIGFNTSAPYINLLGGVVIVILGIFIWWLYPKLAGGLTATGKEGLKIPVLVYSIIICLMVYSALMTWTRPGWTSISALSASIGAMLFLTSDLILAWDRFLKPISHARLRTMVTYHLGQIGIVLGVILHAGLN